MRSRSRPLVAKHRAALADNSRQGALSAHDGVDILVRGRSFVAELVGEAVIEPNAVELALQVIDPDSVPRFRAAPTSAGAVGAGAERFVVAAADNVIGRRSH